MCTEKIGRGGSFPKIVNFFFKLALSSPLGRWTGNNFFFKGGLRAVSVVGRRGSVGSISPHPTSRCSEYTHRAGGSAK